MSRQLINEYRAELDRLRAISGSRRESVLREAFKDLLKRWGRAHDLRFIAEHDILTRQMTRIYVDGALLHGLRVPFAYCEAKDENDDLDSNLVGPKWMGTIAEQIRLEVSGTREESRHMTSRQMPASSGSRALTNARSAKQDEFYTQYVDIQKEVEAYLEFDPDTFRDKVVYCNCDDPFESNFFKFFAANFNRLSLKKLISTSYNGSNIAGVQLTLDEYAQGKKDAPKPSAIALEIEEVYPST